jgi:plasmid maintenance system killer protein
MEESFSIDEILSAVDEIQNKKKKIKIETIKNSPIQKDFSAVPKNTLKLIEEAENN